MGEEGESMDEDEEELHCYVRIVISEATEGGRTVPMSSWEVRASLLTE